MGGNSTHSPNLSNRVLSMATNKSVGQQLGANELQVNINQLPNHNHRLSIPTLSKYVTSKNANQSHYHTVSPKTFSFPDYNTTYNTTFAFKSKKTLYCYNGMSNSAVHTALFSSFSPLKIEKSYHSHTISSFSQNTCSKSAAHGHTYSFTHKHSIGSSQIYSGSQTKIDIRQPTAYVNFFIYVGE